MYLAVYIGAIAAACIVFFSCNTFRPGGASMRRQDILTVLVLSSLAVASRVSCGHGCSGAARQCAKGGDPVRPRCSVAPAHSARP